MSISLSKQKSLLAVFLLVSAGLLIFVPIVNAESDDSPCGSNRVDIKIPYFFDPPAFGSGSGQPCAQVTIPGTGIIAGQPLPSFGRWVIAAYTFGIGIAGVLALMMMMVGGLFWLMSGGNSAIVTKGKDWITNALIGLMLAIFSYALLYTINPNIVSNVAIKNVDQIGGSAEVVSESESNTKNPLLPKRDELLPARQQCVLGGKSEAVKYGGVACKDLCGGKDFKQTDIKNRDGSRAEPGVCCNCERKDSCVEEGERCDGGSDDVCCGPLICRKITGLWQNRFRCSYLAQPGENCREDEDCASGACNKTGRDQCVPFGGELNETACNRDFECASLNCDPAFIDECK